MENILSSQGVADADPELLRRLEGAIARVTRVQREIFLAKRLNGMSYAGIARRTGLTVRQVERHMGRALYKLTDGERLSWWEHWL